MFVQVITALVGDEHGARDALEEWERTLMPGAEGYIGTTAGFTDDGTLVLIARFTSHEAAERNSERPEQAAWWDKMDACLDSEPSVIDSIDARTWADGGSDRAGFVQVMIGRSPDVEALRALTGAEAGVVREVRPDVIGGTFAAFGEDGYVHTVYFRSQGEARAAEAVQPTSKVREAIEEHTRLLGTDVLFLDLNHPILVSARA